MKISKEPQGHLLILVPVWHSKINFACQIPEIQKFKRLIVNCQNAFPIILGNAARFYTQDTMFLYVSVFFL